MKLWILLIAIITTSCTIRERRGEDIRSLTSAERQAISAHLGYIKDERTGLCFAVLTTDQDGFRNAFSITNVPCIE